VIVLVLGLGRGAALAAAALADPRVDRVDVHDPDPAVATPVGCRRLPNGEQVHADLVIVAGPPESHLANCLAALATGSIVLCETPPVSTVAEARALAGAAARSGKTVMLAEDYLWLDWMEPTHAVHEDGALGEVVAARGAYLEDARAAFHIGGRPTWRSTMAPLHYTTHILAPLLDLTGDRVETVWGFDGPRHAGGAAAVAHAVMRTNTGIVIDLTVGFGASYPYGFELELVGSRRSVRLEQRTDGRSLHSGTQAHSGWVTGPDGSLADDGAQRRTHAMVGHALDVVGGAVPRCGTEHMLRNVLPGIAAAASAASGSRPEAVPNPRDWLPNL